MIKKHWSKILLLIFIGVLIIICIYILRSGWLKVKSSKVIITKANCVSDAQIQNLPGVLDNYLFWIDETSLRKKIITTFSCVKEVELIKKIPNQIQINISGRIGMACVKYLPDDKFSKINTIEASPSSSTAMLDWTLPQEDIKTCLISDNEGVIFDQTDQKYYPEVYINQPNIKLNDHLDRDVFEKVSVIFKSLIKEGIALDNHLSIKMFNQTVQIYSLPKIVLSLDKDLFRQLASLQLILQKAKIDQKGLETVDLRFDKPVIIFSNGKR